MTTPSRALRAILLAALHGVLGLAVLAPALHAQSRLAPSPGAAPALEALTTAAREGGADAATARALAEAVAGEVKLTATGQVAGEDQFGYTVALDGDRALIGELSYPGVGAAYVFDFDGTAWTQTARLITADTYRGAFALAVALDGDVAVIGSPYANDPTLPGIPQTGKAYVFTFDGTTWVEQPWLVPSDGADAVVSRFGSSVAIAGGVIVVGAPEHFYIDEDTDTFYDDVGAAYVFGSTGAGWTEEAMLVPPDPRDDGIRFGRSVGTDGTRVLVNSRNATTGRGEAVVFTRGGGAWPQEAVLVASDGAANDGFGNSVALTGGRAVVSAIRSPGFRGAAYVFDYDSTAAAWAETARLTASDAADNDFFGNALAVLGDRVLVGALRDDAIRGAAYLFALDGGAWVETARLVAADGVAGDALGTDVALSETHALAGAYNANGGLGAAYVFPLARAPITVTDAGDEPDADLEDGVCDADLGEAGEQCTLRAALEVANAQGGVDRVVFDVEADAFGGVVTIALESPLPPLTEPVEIDAAAAPARGAGAGGGMGARPGGRRLP